MYTPDQYSAFLDSIFVELSGLGVDLSDMSVDHIAVQASSSEDYDSLKPSFLALGEQVEESIVGGRRVGIFKLNAPIGYKDQLIPVIELIEPKAGQVCSSGLEHAEFVINEDFESFAQRYPNIAWDLSAVNREMYPKVQLKLNNGFGVKFHQKSVLAEVEELRAK